MTAEPRPGVDLYLLPLGAGDLYHSALEVRVAEGRYVVEMTPIPDGNGARRGVVSEGAVGARLAGRFRLFRYEVRRWCGGIIPDAEEAVDSPRRLTNDPEAARHVLDLVPRAPTPVWGRDEVRAGEMWNSNSLIAWLIARSGLSTDRIHVPAGGRAPGWQAGLVVAGRAQPEATRSPRPEAGRR